jgi:hypothetical protein
VIQRIQVVTLLIRLGHPSGILETEADVDPDGTTIKVVRTARKISDIDHLVFLRLSLTCLKTGINQCDSAYSGCNFAL